MRPHWTGLGLLLVVPWLASCVTRPEIRLDMGQGPPRIFTPPAAEPPVEVHPEEFTQALAGLVLQTSMRLALPQREGRVVLASWSGREDEAQRTLLRLCEPTDAPDDCLVLPKDAPPPLTLARMRLALSFSLDTVWEGASVALREVVDPLAVKVTVYSAMMTYLLVLMMPEPVTKGLAAVLTVYLVAYLGFGPVWAMVEAGWQLLHDAKGATSTEELKQAGHRFGRVLGDNGTRVLILLATAALGGRTGFSAKGPKLPGFQRAALASRGRTGVHLPTSEQVKTVTLGAKGLVVGLTPTAVAATAMSPPRGTEQATTALETAKAGGKHTGFLKNYRNKPTEELQRGIASLKKQIDLHRDKIAHPEKHIPDWPSHDPRRREALLKRKWPEDIQRQAEQLEILEGLLKERIQPP
jgi:hypothetical protein